MEDNKDVVQNNGETGDVKPEKTYTEQDIQNSFNAGVKKANSDWQKDAKYKEFLDWKKTSQNDSEKINELTNTNTSLTNEIKLLKAQIQVDNSNCKKEFKYFGETVITKTQTAPSLNNGGTQPQTTSNIMNNLIRGARNN